MSAWNKGLTKETDIRVAKYANSNKGKHISEENKRRVSEANKGRIAWNKGLTKETNDSVKAISIAKLGNKYCLGRTCSEENKKRASDFMKGKKFGLGNKSRTGQKRSPDEVAEQIVTYKERGYKPSEYAKLRASEVNKGKPRPQHVRDAVSQANKNRIISSETRQKLSESSTGRLWSDERKKKLSDYWMGRVITREQRDAIRESLLRQHDRLSASAKLLWQDPVKVEKMVAKMRKARQVRPNNLESSIIEMLNKNFPDEWKYTGNGGLVINRYCPDFLRNHGHNQLIEIYGDYWHKGENPQDRIDLFDSFGYKTLVLWESEVHKMSEAEFIKCIIDFMNMADLFYYKPKINVMGE
jgi:hypothetical protein